MKRGLILLALGVVVLIATCALPRVTAQDQEPTQGGGREEPAVDGRMDHS
ncbi:MAG: hypothetical protein AB2A00_02620 [Myxococcota bacterium]